LRSLAGDMKAKSVLGGGQTGPAFYPLTLPLDIFYKNKLIKNLAHGIEGRCVFVCRVGRKKDVG
jgi:hypothetical protein